MWYEESPRALLNPLTAVKGWGDDTQQETRNNKREKEKSVFEVGGKDSEPLQDPEKDCPERKKTRRQPLSVSLTACGSNRSDPGRG